MYSRDVLVKRLRGKLNGGFSVGRVADAPVGVGV
jgi:hypothetical protein